ncbi:hypothetical protein [Saccharophagus degradans]|uniref:Uncharacterized protein n=1 Tax=Saccharophagus degradans (strain 2-40 / ATCC 43961 / DSM 17024) TaxID=203122 RepID=Q21DN2_SACD2|nr:hypothetical protein [Saccharophagus degradans]ABD83197.1 hypothetical protein Sde_3942 [Saccharophagus degradans 2-40]
MNTTSSTSKPLPQKNNAELQLTDALAKIALLEKQNIALQNSVNQLDIKAVSPASDTTTYITEQPASKADTPNLERLQAMEAEYQFNHGEKKLERLKQKHQLDTKAAITAEFDEEPVDESWAYQWQTELDKQLAENDALAQLSVVASECKTTQCKISLLHSQSSDQTLTTYEIFSNLNNNQQWGAYIVTADPDTGITDIYFQKEEHTAEQY